MASSPEIFLIINSSTFADSYLTSSCLFVSVAVVRGFDRQLESGFTVEAVVIAAVSSADIVSLQDDKPISKSRKQNLLNRVIVCTS